MYRTSEKILLHFKTSLHYCSITVHSCWNCYGKWSVHCKSMLRIINDLVFILNTSFSASWTSDLCCLSQGWYFHRGEGSLLLRVHLVRLITWHMLLTTKTAVCFMLIVWLVSFAKIIPCDCGDWLWRVLGAHSHFTTLLQWEDGN